MSTGTGDSILKPVDIHFTVAYHITKTVCVLICQLSNFRNAQLWYNREGSVYHAVHVSHSSGRRVGVHLVNNVPGNSFTNSSGELDNNVPLLHPCVEHYNYSTDVRKNQ